MEVLLMIEQLELMMANRYFDRRMRAIFVDRCNSKGIETFEEYLAYRYRDNCYYYSGYAIIGLNNDDYLMRGDLCISGDFIWENGGYSHGWVEFKYKGKEYVFDSMCRGIVTKAEWYEEFKPNVNFKHSKQEIIESFKDKLQILSKNCYRVQGSSIHDYYTVSVYERGKLFMHGEKIKKFIAYDEPSY